LLKLLLKYSKKKLFLSFIFPDLSFKNTPTTKQPNQIDCKRVLIKKHSYHKIKLSSKDPSFLCCLETSKANPKKKNPSVDVASTSSKSSAKSNFENNKMYEFKSNLILLPK